MYIEYGNLYKKSEKCIQKHYKELKTLDMIKNHIRQCSFFYKMKKNPISNMYGFEALKYELNGYYSFNLNRNRGVIRLILSIRDKENVAVLEYISMNYYEDFKKIRKG